MKDHLLCKMPFLIMDCTHRHHLYLFCKDPLERDVFLGKYKKQHFVPRFYLKNFGVHKETIFCYDKHKNRCFKSNVGDIAQGKYFYELNHMSGFVEEPLSSQEKQFSIAHSELMRSKDLNTLSIYKQA